ncbi:hypothetical protein [Allonocardiopsis opalescens]|uniref:Putative secreted protein with PEP-CTERM sorting signal n=1 Tax=Allonocardiopsis opalescens TaxID=1144618 RepID=A0A2T0Q4T8_9ACTN|nr:hypothetical protein [Allonocardiopsis opalescens]PRX98783.1 putative secreted protein with PEP-CTERM sorting signal [Allonocardiopsis opalescens]
MRTARDRSRPTTAAYRLHRHPAQTLLLAAIAALPLLPDPSAPATAAELASPGLESVHAAITVPAQLGALAIALAVGAALARRRRTRP